jgi:hypothetical protein
MKTIVRVLLALATAALATSAHAEWQWQHFGVAKFADSRESAMAQKGAVLKKLDYPEGAAAALAKAMEQPGVPVELSNGDKFVAQISKGGQVHGLREGGGIIAFEQPTGMKFSAKAERWQVAVEGVIYTLDLPEICQNFTRRLEVPAPLPPAPPVVALRAPVAPPQFQPVALPPTCPEMYTLKVNLWPPEAANFPGVAATLAKEDQRQGEFSKTEHFSRKHGGQMRQALADGKLVRSTIGHQLQVSLIATAESRGGESTIDAEEVLGGVMVNGLLELTFTRAQIEKWDAIQLVSVDDVRSPPKHPKTGRKELRFFNHTVRVPKGGEWDLNDCISNVHLIEKQPAAVATK